MSWRSLHVSAAAGTHLPPLLISVNFTKDFYTVHLSDLTSIWTETLNHRDIIVRSREESTSIDPSSRDQFQIFRNKIKLGLEGGSDTALALTVQADSSRPSLVLNVTVDLPGGLPPLHWPFRLAAASPSLLTSQLIAPLLRAQHERMQETSSLAELLKEKDHVIRKLLDKLESQGTELGQVFPQVANKVGRKVDRQKAAEKVKGLTPFNVAVWRSGLVQEESRSIAQLVGEVLGASTDAPALLVEDQIQEEDPEEWWENIQGITVDLQTGKISTKGPSRGIRKTTPLPKPKPQPTLARQESTNDDNDDFQVQATPPRSSAVLSPSKAAVDESTDDDDLDVPSQRSKVPDSYPRSPPPPIKPPSPKPAKKFGKLGGKKATLEPPPPVKNDDTTDDDDPIPPPQPRKTASSEASATEDEANSPPPKSAPKAHSPTPEPPPIKPQKKIGKIGGKREAPPPPPAASETDDEPEDVGPEPLLPRKAPSPPVVKPKKAKFGQIGGKKKAAETTPAPEESIAESSTTSTTPKAGVKRKFGALGHKASPSKTVKQESSSQTADEDSGRGRASHKPEREATPPRETSEERANKKREQLQRELEEKAKAPAKKKRKF